jgi:hypothetical protein
MLSLHPRQKRRSSKKFEPLAKLRRPVTTRGVRLRLKGTVDVASKDADPAGQFCSSGDISGRACRTSIHPIALLLKPLARLASSITPTWQAPRRADGLLQHPSRQSRVEPALAPSRRWPSGGRGGGVTCAQSPGDEMCRCLRFPNGQAWRHRRASPPQWLMKKSLARQRGRSTRERDSRCGHSGSAGFSPSLFVSREVSSAICKTPPWRHGRR